MENQLLIQFDRIFAYCFQLFRNKNADYGPAWLLYRYPSLNDEIWRKAKRIRTLEEHEDIACVPEGRDVEYIGIINYCLMFLIKLEKTEGIPTNEDMTKELSVLDSIPEEVIYKAYQDHVTKLKDLLIQKNTDYGDAWKGMSIGSMTDQVLIRVYRIRRILLHEGRCKVSEGIAAQLYDIINYCVFALIKMNTKLMDGK